LDAQTPAVYVYGDELQASQAQFAEIMSYDGSPHTPWLAGEVFNRLLPENLEKFKEYERATGMPEAAVEAKVAEETADCRSRVMEDLVSIYGDEAQERFSSDTELHVLIEERRTGFMKEATSREHELERCKSDFTTLVECAIEYGGLPITKEQLYQRLSGVKIGFSDMWNVFSLDATGTYDAKSHAVDVNIGLGDSDLRQAVFHELFHAISGQRITRNDTLILTDIESRRIGLKNSPQDRKVWLNEAITDSLANIFVRTSGPFLTNFGDTEKPLPLPITFESKDILEGYHAEIMAATLVLGKVPAHTLLRAYFTQDNDPFEEDQRAGIHAERELWRAVKIASGAKRIADLRLLEGGFDDDESKKQSLSIALSMAVSDSKVPRFKEKARQRTVWRNTAKRTRMLDKAKTYTKNLT